MTFPPSHLPRTTIYFLLDQTTHGVHAWTDRNQIGVCTFVLPLVTGANQTRLLFTSPPAESLLRLLRLSLRLRSDRQRRRCQVQGGQVLQRQVLQERWDTSRTYGTRCRRLDKASEVVKYVPSFPGTIQGLSGLLSTRIVHVSIILSS